MDFPKIHDPIHNDELIEQFEMIFEKQHKENKQKATMFNGQDIETVLINKVNKKIKK